MITIIGPAFTKDGLCAKRYIGDDWRVRTHGYCTPSLELRRQQPSYIPLCLDHDETKTLGRVVALHRSAGGDCWAVCQSDADFLADYDEGPLYFSPKTLMTPDWEDIKVEHLAITTSPATLGLQPIEILHGGLRDRGGWEHRGDWVLHGLRKELVEEATGLLRQRRWGEANPTPVLGEPFAPDGRRLSDLNEHEVFELLEEQEYERQRPVGPMRPAGPRGRILRVS